LFTDELKLFIISLVKKKSYSYSRMRYTSLKLALCLLLLFDLTKKSTCLEENRQKMDVWLNKK
ncbi:MAG: hypothetical protein ACJ712_07840, partial [Nitrososphaeraceae archaeon]